MSHFKLINHLLLLFIQIQVYGQATTPSELHDHPLAPRQIESELIAKEVYEDTVYYSVGYSTFKYENINGIRPKENKITGKVTRLSYLLPETEDIDKVNIFFPYKNFLIDNGFERIDGTVYLGFFKFKKTTMHPYVRNISLEDYSGPTDELYEQHPAYQGGIYCFEKNTPTGTVYVIIVQSTSKPYNKNYYIDIVETNNTARLTERQIASSLHKNGKLNVYGILFPVNSYEIQKGSGQNINSLAGYLKKNPGVKILIVGHTDNTGNPKSNLELSQLRAKAIKNNLVDSFGISPERIATKGEGDTQPVADNQTEQGRKLNRRVEIILQPE